MFESDADFDFNDDLPLNSKVTPFKRPTDSAPRESIKKPKITPKKGVKRKFPGPAGILPDFDLTTLQNPNKNEEMPCSQMSLSVFQSGPWMRMNRDYRELVEEFNIKWIKNSASLDKLHNQKAPFLGAVIQSIECLDKTVHVVLKDATGEIQGTITQNLYEEYSDSLVVGAVIVLRRFGVLTTGGNSNHYLTITVKNLVSIYTKSKEDTNEESEVKAIKVQQLSCEDLIADSAHSTEAAHSKQDNLFEDEFIIPDNFEDSISKDTEISKKFTFKKKKIVINSSQASVSATEEDSEIWQHVLEGVDADSFFEDF